MRGNEGEKAGGDESGRVPRIRDGYGAITLFLCCLHVGCLHQNAKAAPLLCEPPNTFLTFPRGHQVPPLANTFILAPALPRRWPATVW